MQPRVSVIIPVRNGAAYLRRCLDALKQSTASDWECIVVDDASSDGSAEIAAEYGARVVRLENHSYHAGARNLGVDHSRGELLFFTDADVCVRPDTIERIERAFDEDADLAALMGSYDDRPGSPEFVSQYRNLLHCYTHQSARERASTFWTGCGAVRREAFLAVGGFRLRRSIADIELGYQLTQAGRKIRLDRNLKVQHLKRWTFSDMVFTDVFVRGIPWVEMILSYRNLPNDLNVSSAQRLSVVLMYAAVAFAALTAFKPLTGIFCGAALAGVVLLNRGFYEFLARRRGLLFAARSIPLHLLYHLYNGLSLIVGVAHYLVRRPALRRGAALFVLAVFSAGAADDWKQFKSGPFQVLTTASEKPARAVLNDLEQMRYVLGTLLGKQDLKSVWPMRFVVVKSDRSEVFPVPKLARDAMVASLSELTPAAKQAVIAELLESNAGRMPPGIERGLTELFSTFSADGPRISIGAAPPQPDRDWARLRMFVLDPRFSGKVRVLLYNLQQGLDPVPAYSNAFNMTPEQVEHELDAYMKQDLSEPGSVPGRPLSPRRELLAWDVDAQAGELARADVLVANGKADRTAYARFPGALDTPVPLVDLARKESVPAKSRPLLEQAAKLNPQWAEPLWLEAQIESNPARKVQLIKNAAQLAPRNASYWIALAHAQEAAGQFGDAVKTWVSAERAAATPEDRARITEMRVTGEKQRQQQAQYEREAEERQKRAELEALRQKALENIRLAEARANAGKAARDPNEKLDFYREDMGYGKVEGRLQRVDCIARASVLHIVTPDGKPVRLFVPNPTKVAISGGGEHALVCGVQRRPRNVTVEYVEKANGKLGTAGEVTTVEFR